MNASFPNLATRNAQLFFLLLLLLVAFHASAQKPAVKKKLHIFTLGDSNGTFPHSWPNQLQSAFPDAALYNSSKSGRTIGFVNNGDSSLNSLLVLDENIKKAVAAAKGDPYDFIVLELGTNDGKAVFADRQKEVPRNLAMLIQKIKNCPYPEIKPAKLIIISPPPYGKKAESTEKYRGGDRRVKKMSKRFRKVAKRNNCFFVNGYKTPELDINKMTPDGLHLDPEGSRLLIQPVVNIIKTF